MSWLEVFLLGMPGMTQINTKESKAAESLEGDFFANGDSRRFYIETATQ